MTRIDSTDNLDETANAWVSPRVGTQTGARPRVSPLGEDGFTLMELLITMILVGIMFALYAVVVGGAVHHTAVITNESVVQTQLRTSLNQLTKDLREASLPTTTATSPFDTSGTSGVMSPTQLTFYTPDGTYSAGAPAAFHMRKDSYQLSSGSFQRATLTSSNTGGPPWTGISALPNFATSGVTLFTGVTNSTVFKYYDGSTPPVLTTNPASVRTVVVTATVTIPGTNIQVTYSDSATLRETPPS